ncbi:MAG TPA: hypothetical protein VFF73_30750, partial [Planctomycetota bacterium]|nr:hypothetical protein [Planctomycetota bacterium]
DDWRPFEEARAFARKLKLKGARDWNKLRKKGRRPDDIPGSPHRYYDEWVSWGDFLGTGNILPAKRVFLPFEKARAFARKLGLKNEDMFHLWAKGKLRGYPKRPEGFPAQPSRVYRDDWRGWGDFLGTGNVSSQLRVYRSFEDARAWVRKQKIANVRQWRHYCKHGLPGKPRVPDDIPHSPFTVYEDLWTNWGDWLGNGAIWTVHWKFRPFNEARAFARSLKLETLDEWRRFAFSKERPKDIPSKPHQTYKHCWKGFRDWLGTHVREERWARHFRSFKEARVFVRTLGLESTDEWKKWAKRTTGKRPRDIPAYPWLIYLGKGWRGMNDWLGTERNPSRMRPFREARDFVRALGLESYGDWQKYAKGGKRPRDIPSNPWYCYRGHGWKGIEDWLGTVSLKERWARRFRPFHEARAFARTLGLDGKAGWNHYATRSGKRPRDIPSCPWVVYRGHGWRGMLDWLGAERRPSPFRPFREARAFVHTLGLEDHADWRKYAKSGKRPRDIPATPWGVYLGHGWRGIEDWLGSANPWGFPRRRKPPKKTKKRGRRRPRA